VAAPATCRMAGVARPAFYLFLRFGRAAGNRLFRTCV
jgi:hypothetical protein